MLSVSAASAEMPGARATRNGEREQKFCVPAALALAAQGNRRLAARDEHARGCRRLRMSCTLTRDAGMNERHIAGLTLNAVAKDNGGHTCRARHLCGRFERRLRGSDHDILHIGKPAIVRLRSFVTRVAQAFAHSLRAATARTSERRRLQLRENTADAQLLFN